MKQAWSLYFKQPTTLFGIFAALVFQVVFCVIWITAYDDVTENTDQMKIAIVNEDPGLGKQISEQLKDHLPFQTTLESSHDKAMDQLEKRELHLIIHIPKTFTQQLQFQSPDSKAKIEYTINESNPLMVKSVMQNVTSQVTATINKQATTKGIEMVLAKANMPPQQVNVLAKEITQPVEDEVKSLHPVDRFSKQMIPMMLVLASYAGALIMGFQLHESTKKIGSQVCKWRSFVIRVCINFGSAILISTAGAGLITLLSGDPEASFFQLWIFQILLMLTFFFVAQMFLYLLDQVGMLINIILLSLQLVASGAIVPRELLSSFYFELGKYLPATYGVEGGMNLLFGGPEIGSEVNALLIMLVISILISALAIWLKKGQSGHCPHQKNQQSTT